MKLGPSIIKNRKNKATRQITRTKNGMTTANLKASYRINVTPLLPPLYCEKVEWDRFKERLKSSGQSLQQYMQLTLDQEIDNTLYDDPRLLSPVNYSERTRPKG